MTKNTVVSTDTTKDLPAQFFKKAHEMVFSQLRLSSLEHDIFALFLTRLHKEHWQNYLDNNDIGVPHYEFSNETLAKWFNLRNKDLYAVLRLPTKRLAFKAIGIADPEKKKFEFYPLFKKVKYEKGILTLIPNDLLIDQYLCVSQGHAQIPHVIFRKLKKEYSKRLYTMLCRFRDKNTELHPQTISSLHAFFGLVDENGDLTKKTYARTNDFISRIIKPSILEVAEMERSIKFEYDDQGNYGFTYIRRGNKIESLKFLYNWK